MNQRKTCDAELMREACAKVIDWYVKEYEMATIDWESGGIGGKEFLGHIADVIRTLPTPEPKADAAGLREACAEKMEAFVSECEDEAKRNTDYKIIFNTRAEAFRDAATAIRALPITASPTDAAVKALQRIEREDRMEYSHARGPYAEIAAEALATLAQHGVK